MGRRLRQFLHLPDRQRAGLLAQVLAVFFVAVLYGLGAVALFLRSRYGVTPTPSARVPAVLATATATEPATIITEPALDPTNAPTIVEARSPMPKPSPTLYPTLTPVGSEGES